MRQDLKNRQLTRAQVQADAKTLLGTRPKVSVAAADQVPTDPANAGSTGELWLYGVVGGWWFGFSAESVAKALRGMDVDTLYVRIHSPGGNSTDGIAIANLLRNHKAHIVTVVDGLAASAASVIASAGDEIVMCPGSQQMLHDVLLLTYGNAAELRRDAEWIDGQSQNYAGVYAYRAGGDAAKWRQVMLANEGDGTWYTAEQSVSAGLADKVGTVVAQGSPPTAPDDQLEEDDEMYARAAHDVDVLDRYVHPAAAAAWCGQRPLKLPTASADGPTPPKEGDSPMARISDAGATTIGQKLGIAEDADEATILAALDEALDEHAEPEPADIPEGHVVVPKAKLDDLEAGAKAGTAAAKQLHEQARAALLDANRSKFLPTSRASWEAEYDRDPDGVREHFAAAPDIVPVSEHGHSLDTEPTSDPQADVKAVVESDVYKNWSMD